MRKQYFENTIRPIHYIGDIPLPNAPCEIGARFNRGTDGVYEMTRITDGIPYGVHEWYKATYSPRLLE